MGSGWPSFLSIYLIVATQLVMAYFRNWQEIHYAGYFSKFGKSLPEIASNMATHPVHLWEAFGNAHSAEYALMLVAPLGFLPLLSPGRLAVALPLFLTLCLNEVIDSPMHHVHAAAVPILLWAAAAGLGTVSRQITDFESMAQGSSGGRLASRRRDSGRLVGAVCRIERAGDGGAFRAQPTLNQFLGSALGFLLAGSLRREKAGRTL